MCTQWARAGLVHMPSKQPGHVLAKCSALKQYEQLRVRLHNMLRFFLQTNIKLRNVFLLLPANRECVWKRVEKSRSQQGKSSCTSNEIVAHTSTQSNRQAWLKLLVCFRIQKDTFIWTALQSIPAGHGQQLLADLA